MVIFKTFKKVFSRLKEMVKQKTYTVRGLADFRYGVKPQGHMEIIKDLSTRMGLISCVQRKRLFP